mmetsp:Transcript_9589/g.31312  ORF Transcript_9589/g.31312 Transcript_9589/m.31312 type:complete len:693 (-) Transcript_9589:110-2188(-)
MVARRQRTSDGEESEARKSEARKSEEEEKAQTPPKKGSTTTLRSYLTSSTLATAAAVVYVGLAARNFSALLDPLAQLPNDSWKRGPLVRPLWPENCVVSVEIALSTLPKLPVDLARNETALKETTAVAWRSEGFRLNASSTAGETIKLELYNEAHPPTPTPPPRGKESSSALASLASSLFAGNRDEAPPTRLGLPAVAWEQIERNGSLYLHAAVSQEPLTSGAEGKKKKAPRWRGLADNDARRTARLEPLPLVKYEAPPTGFKALPKRKLLGNVPFFGRLGPPAPWSPPAPPEGTFYAKWKPEAAVRVVAEFREWPEGLYVPGLKRVRERVPGGGRVESYAPPTYADEIGLTSDKYVTLNSSLGVNATIPLALTFSTMSFARWQLIAKMEDGLRAQQRDFGFSDNDVDEVRRLIADTQTWLLLVTLVASALHLLFEFLAFKSDVEFWQNNKSLQGLSARSVVVELISQIVVLMFLVDEGASLLVSVPSFFGILVQCWKVRKATGLTIDLSKRFFVSMPRLGPPKAAQDDDSFEDDSDQTREQRRLEEERRLDLFETTQRVDAVATFYLSVLLLPLIVGWSLKSLVYDAHRGWYSWILSSATASVYTFGFIIMVPQLALNYTLKSVSHLPWKLLCFRFVNTFIDDLFAFVIKMPTMHRVSCFRDDIVFIVYLYQRWIYPVDLYRGTAAEDAAH